LSGTWFAVALITPEFLKMPAESALTSFIKDILNGTLYFLISLLIEQVLENKSYE
jgi:hypothetical protein